MSEPRSILQSGSLRGFWLRKGDELAGWTVYHYSPFQLEHIVIGGRAQQNMETAHALLYHIQKLHPKHDIKVENIPALSPLWPVFQNAGYIETFRRLEMIVKF